MTNRKAPDKGISIHELPENILRSRILSADDKAQLTGVPELPVIDPAYYDDRLKNIFQYYAINPEEMEKELQCYAKELLQESKIQEAWQVLLSAG